MPRSKSPLRIQMEYLPARGLLRLLQILPRRWSNLLCRGLLRTVLAAIPKRRRLIDDNLRHAFPQFSSRERRIVARQSIDCLARGISLFTRIPALCRQGIEEVVEVTGLEHLDKALQRGKGVIPFTAHIGCWEIMAVYITRLYRPIGMLTRPLDNPRLEAMVAEIRSAGGGIIVHSRHVFKEGLRILRNNGILGTLIDQNFHEGGVFVDFFGRPAATTSVVSVLARRTGAAVIPMHNVWRDGKIRILCEEPLALSKHPDATQAIAEDTQAMTRIVEGWIRENPGQWLWLHNRWKRRPHASEKDR